MKKIIIMSVLFLSVCVFPNVGCSEGSDSPSMIIAEKKQYFDYAINKIDMQLSSLLQQPEKDLMSTMILLKSEVMSVKVSLDSIIYVNLALAEVSTNQKANDLINRMQITILNHVLSVERQLNAMSNHNLSDSRKGEKFYELLREINQELAELVQALNKVVY